MTDIYTNEKPFGLMSAELQAAMRAHHKAGGKIEYFSTGEWANSAYPFSSHITYRAVRPAPTHDVIAWDRLPDWVQSVARDESGRVYAHETKTPVRDAIGWGGCGRSCRIDDFPGLVQIGTCDWKDSKQLRPGVV